MVVVVVTMTASKIGLQRTATTMMVVLIVQCAMGASHPPLCDDIFGALVACCPVKDRPPDMLHVIVS